jgi:rhodanese-related sulfurtransferase
MSQGNGLWSTVLAANTVEEKRFAMVSPAALRAMIGDGGELAIIDAREEGAFGAAHLLYAANLPLSRLELRIASLVPRKTTRVVLTDAGDGISQRAASTLRELDYTDVAILAGGYPAREAAGCEIFSGMSVIGKAFGEWIAVNYGTPTITAEELHAKIKSGEDILVLDSRPSNEYVNMNIPGSINVPVSELVYRFHELAPKPEALIVVNCAGRTRSLIGAQSLINAGSRTRWLPCGAVRWHGRWRASGWNMAPLAALRSLREKVTGKHWRWPARWPPASGSGL